MSIKMEIIQRPLSTNFQVVFKDAGYIHQDKSFNKFKRTKKAFPPVKLRSHGFVYFSDASLAWLVSPKQIHIHTQRYLRKYMATPSCNLLMDYTIVIIQGRVVREVENGAGGRSGGGNSYTQKPI